MMISESTFKEWGGETFITQFDKETSAWILIAIHSTKSGPAAGGIRMARYPNLEHAVNDVLRLSKAMTLKYATVNMSWGGGKTVIVIPSELSSENRKGLLLRFGKLIKDLSGKYYVGPDIGTSSADMDILFNDGVPFVFSRAIELGGAGSSSIPTAHGVYAGIEASLDHIYGSSKVEGRTIAVQGVGNVGGLLVKLLLDSGAKVLFSEIDDVLVRMYRKLENCAFVNEHDIYSVECDVFSPCAQGAILNENTIPQLKCKAVVGAANNQLSLISNALELQQRGILYAPDYVVNLGGAMGITLIEAEGKSMEESFLNVKSSIYKTLKEIFQRSSQREITTLQAAEEIALKKLNNQL